MWIGLMPLTASSDQPCPVCGSRMPYACSVFCSRACYNSLAAKVSRFLAKVNKNGPIPEHVPELGQCWIWTGHRMKNGYGQVSYMGKPQLAHRVSFLLHNGSFPENLAIHKCDGGAIGCVRPEHIIDGTTCENTADCISKGRFAAGEQKKLAKLTHHSVAEIRELAGRGQTQKSIAIYFGVSQGLVNRVVNLKRWKKTRVQP
jgi:hypothetical protein